MKQSNNAYGGRFSEAIYFMENIRNQKSNVFILFTYIEEMAHHYWKISDETLVKNKVEEIIKQLYPDFTLDYMRKRCNLYGL